MSEWKGDGGRGSERAGKEGGGGGGAEDRADGYGTMVDVVMETVSLFAPVYFQQSKKFLDLGTVTRPPTTLAKKNGHLDYA